MLTAEGARRKGRGTQKLRVVHGLRRPTVRALLMYAPSNTRFNGQAIRYPRKTAHLRLRHREGGGIPAVAQSRRARTFLSAAVGGCIRRRERRGKRRSLES